MRGVYCYEVFNKSFLFSLVTLCSKNLIKGNSKTIAFNSYTFLDLDFPLSIFDIFS